MPRLKDQPLTSYDPRYEQLLLKGARGESFTIQCRSISEAKRLQHLLHSFRQRMKKRLGEAGRERWEPLYTAAVGIQKDAKGELTVLRIYSRHHEFDDILNDILPPVDSTPPLAVDPLDTLGAPVEKEPE